MMKGRKGQHRRRGRTTGEASPRSESLSLLVASCGQFIMLMVMMPECACALMRCVCDGTVQYHMPQDRFGSSPSFCCSRACHMPTAYYSAKVSAFRAASPSALVSDCKTGIYSS